MKYSIAKQVKREALTELFEILSDSIDEGIPDIIWQGLEFELNINQEDILCDIDYHATKKGGEFLIKISWKLPEAKKKSTTKKKGARGAAPASKTESKEDIKKKKRAELLEKASKSTGADPSPEGVTLIEPEEEEEDWFPVTTWNDDEELDWDDEDYEDEW